MNTGFPIPPGYNTYNPDACFCPSCLQGEPCFFQENEIDYSFLLNPYPSHSFVSTPQGQSHTAPFWPSDLSAVQFPTTFPNSEFSSLGTALSQPLIPYDSNGESGFFNCSQTDSSIRMTGPPVQLTPATLHIPEVFVPQREYRPPSPTNIPAALRTIIKFCTKSGSGFPVKDALEGTYADLVGRDDTNMFQQCSSSISIRIEWPGYQSWRRQIKTKDWCKPSRPIKLAKLATEVAKLLRAFVEEVLTQRVPKADQKWRVGHVDSTHISVNRVALVSLHRVSIGSWQPVFSII